MRDIQEQKRPGNDAKDRELDNKPLEIFFGDRVVEWLIPRIKLGLSEGSRGDDGEEAEAKQ